MLKLIHGDNTYGSYQELNKVLKKNPEYKIIDGSKLDNLDDIFVSVESMTLFASEPSLTIVKRLSKNRKKSLQDQLVEEIKDIKSNDVNLVLWEDKSMDKRSKLYKLLKKNADVSECAELDEPKLIKWVQQEAERFGLSVSSKIAIGIIDRVGVNQFNLTSELEKISLLVLDRDNKLIVEDDLEIVSNSDKEADIWKLMDAISSKNKKQIMILGNEFLRNQAEFPYLISMLTRQLKILMLMKHPQTTSQEISSKLKIHPYTLSRARKHLHLFDLDRIKLLINKLSNLDFAIKEGRIDATLGLNLFLASL
ncbi:DNA polymerase III subunit delta [Candidatus Dojkabacteria bacterium]|uniref:DNA polymerase III subunit delta n=1 Tax=Candidatus Dojkabacteria bacterium TaxID=2099670 RepID=A0A955RIP6_9BACT|nr:DNA polymerase III subunit delta [Candidatus Dojkabacteria bacterium]